MIQKLKQIFLFVLVAAFAFGTTAFADRTFTLPDQTGRTGQFLQTNGTNPLWAVAGAGAVNSVTGTDPITVNNAVPTAPVIGLALQTDGTLAGDGSTSNPLMVVGGSTTGVLPVRVATTGALSGTPTYSNGASGVGATLTRTGNGALGAIDGVTLVVGNRLLVKNQAAQLQNGVYQVTVLGSAGAPYVLTRTTDSDATSEFAGQQVSIALGTTNHGTIYQQTNTVTTVGTTSVIYAGPTGLYVTQLSTGTQVNGAIPTWTGVAKELRKSGADFFYDVNQFTMNGTSFGAFRQINASSNNLGAAGNGLSLYAGDAVGPNAATSGATSNVEFTAGGRWVNEQRAWSPGFNAISSLNGTAGQSFQTVTNTNTGQYSQMVQTTTAVNMLADDASGTNIPTVTVDSGTQKAYIANLVATNRAIDVNLGVGGLQKTSFNVPSNFTSTSTVTVNGSQATKVHYIDTTVFYNFDSFDPLVPDNTIYADTLVAGGQITIDAIPPASDFQGREFTVINGNSNPNIPYAVRLNFNASDYNAIYPTDLINESPFESVTYKSVTVDASNNWIWVRKSVNQPRHGVIPVRYGDSVVAVNRQKVSYIFDGGAGPSNVDISLVDILVGSEITVADFGLDSSSNHITIDAGVGGRIVDNTAAQTRIISTDGESLTLLKVNSTDWKII